MTTFLWYLHFCGHTQQHTPVFLLMFLKHQQVSWDHDGDMGPCLPYLFNSGRMFTRDPPNLFHYH